jgi:hypothetical protein
MRFVESHVRTVSVGRAVGRKDLCGSVERSEAVCMTTGRGERLTVGGCQPRAKQRASRSAEGACVLGHGHTVGRLTDVGEHDGLLGECMGVQGNRFGDLRGSACFPVVPPRVDDLVSVERLPPGKRVRVGKDHSERRRMVGSVA